MMDNTVRLRQSNEQSSMNAEAAQHPPLIVPSANEMEGHFPQTDNDKNSLNPTQELSKSDPSSPPEQASSRNKPIEIVEPNDVPKPIVEVDLEKKELPVVAATEGIKKQLSSTATQEKKENPDDPSASKTDTSPVITMEMVSKTYGEDPLDFKTLVLKNIYLEVFDGEFVIVFGPSGSGKSTILHIMAGLEKPTAGRVLVRDQDLSKFDNEALSIYHRTKMGMVFQSFNLIKSLNVWENVALPQTASGINQNIRKDRALQLLKVLNIDHYANRHPNEISGGEQQRVAIARALINNPFFLLIDEPTGNLDSKSAEEVMNLIYELNMQGGHTVVLVTHNPAHLRYATRVVYVEDGKIVIEEKRDRGMFSPSTSLLRTEEYKKLLEYKGVDNAVG